MRQAEPDVHGIGPERGGEAGKEPASVSTISSIVSVSWRCGGGSVDRPGRVGGVLSRYVRR